MPREILVNWTTASGSGKVSVMYFSESGPSVSDQRLALSQFLASLNGALHTSTTWTIATTGRELDATTGTLTGLWTEATARTGTGTAASTSVIPDASQALVRWASGTIINGRLLKGRTFIPGLASGNLTGGNLSPALLADWGPKISIFVGAGSGFQVWHRPVAGAGGQQRPVINGALWPELAVLRRRRG